MFALFPYTHKSKGAKALAAELDCKLLVGDYLHVYASTPYNDGKPFFLINWGNGSIGSAIKKTNATILNPVKGVNLARNKLRFFDCQTSAKTPARVPVYTADREEALSWVEQGIVVMGRRVNGSCGTDIAFFEDDPQAFNESEFWVQYKKKKEEYRIHFVRGTMIAAQKKALRETDENGQKIDTSEVDFRIRNHKNGFIFKRHDITVPGDVVDQARIAIENTGLDFGAVDVIWNQYEGKAYVLEINTAPGLEGTTVLDYANAFRAL